MKEIKPRGKGVVSGSLGLKDSFKEFDKTQPKSFLYVDYKTYRAVCERFNVLTVEDILLNSGELQLPYRLGEIRIQKKKMQFDTAKMKIDWKASREADMIVYHMNDHRDNYRYRWYWKKKSVIVQNKTLYSFTPTRDNKRMLAKLLKESKQIDYFE